MLPRDFVPWKKACHYFWHWTQQKGCRQVIHDVLGGPAHTQADAWRKLAATILNRRTVLAMASFRWLRCRLADQVYSGEDFAAWVRAHRKTGTPCLEVVARDKTPRGFATLPKRWSLERTFDWFMKHRLLVSHYEIKTRHAQLDSASA